jgi:hypothetical protein
MNSDATDAGYSMGVLSTAMIAAQPGFAGNNLDEMAFSFILTKPSIVSASTWTTSSASGSCIYFANLDPMSFYYRPINNVPIIPTLSTTNATYCFSNLMYVVNAFAMWRGSFVFTFSINKTQYHTGRLLVSHIPTETDSYLLYPDITTTNLVRSALWDISDTNTFEFIVPYIHSRPYCDRGTSIGSLSVVVENVLNCPTTVSSSLEIAVTVAGGDDFEVALPTRMIHFAAPTINNAYVYQSGLEAATTCIGEKVLSVKQLISRYTNFSLLAGFTQITLYPWYNVAKNRWLASNGTANIIDVSPDSYWVSAYAYARGGSRYSVRPFVNLFTILKLSDASAPDETSSAIVEPNAPIYATVPYYNINSRSLILEYGVGTDEVGLRSRPTITSWPFGHYPCPYTGLIQAAAADDAQLGYWLGPPPFMGPVSNGDVASVYWTPTTPKPLVEFSRAIYSIPAGAGSPLTNGYVAPTP